MKQILKYVLIVVMILSLSMTPITAVTSEESYAGNQLRILGILRGYEDGSLRLDQPIIRSEVVTLAVRILGYENVDVPGEGIDFTDVEPNYWAYDTIQKAYKLRVINGYPDLSFKPTGNITYSEVVAVMINALGEQDDLVGTWPNNYLDKAKAIGVIPSDSMVDPTRVITRGEMSVIVWDTLLVKE